MDFEVVLRRSIETARITGQVDSTRPVRAFIVQVDSFRVRRLQARSREAPLLAANEVTLTCSQLIFAVPF